VSVELLEEEDPPSTGAAWAPVSWSLVPRSVRIAGHLPSAQLDEDLGPGDPLPTELVVRCYPNGTTDPMTIFVDWDGAEWRRARRVGMPMTGEPIGRANWRAGASDATAQRLSPGPRPRPRPPADRTGLRRGRALPEVPRPGRRRRRRVPRLRAAARPL